MEGVGLDGGDSETCENGKGQFRGMIIGFGVSLLPVPGCVLESERIQVCSNSEAH